MVDGLTGAVCVSLRPQTHHNAEDPGLAVDADIHDPDRSAVIYYRGTVCLADRLPAAPPPARGSTAEFGSQALSVAEAYQHRLFHGPRFQCLKRIAALNERGIRAYVSPSRPADCVGMERGGSWIIDPILLDAGPQLLILWAQEMRGMTVLPSRFREVRIFDGFGEALLAGASEPLECRLQVDAAGDGPIITASYQVFGPGGEMVLSVEGLESTGNESLNRLATAGKLVRNLNGINRELNEIQGTETVRPGPTMLPSLAWRRIFPGAPDLKTYWRNIVSKVDAVSEAPEDWGADVFYDPGSTGNDRVYCKRGGYLHDLASFDPLEYGVMPSSVDGGEPDHLPGRCAWLMRRWPTPVIAATARDRCAATG